MPHGNFGVKWGIVLLLHLRYTVFLYSISRMKCAQKCSLVVFFAHSCGRMRDVKNCELAMSTKISVLLDDAEAARFDAFCANRGYKKSTLIVRLIKEHLDREDYPLQGSLLSSSARTDIDGAKRKPNS